MRIPTTGHIYYTTQYERHAITLPNGSEATYRVSTPAPPIVSIDGNWLWVVPLIKVRCQIQRWSLGGEIITTLIWTPIAISTNEAPNPH